MSDTVLFTSEDNDIANQSVGMLFFISGKNRLTNQPALQGGIKEDVT